MKPEYFNRTILKIEYKNNNESDLHIQTIYFTYVSQKRFNELVTFSRFSQSCLSRLQIISWLQNVINKWNHSNVVALKDCYQAFRLVNCFI